MDTKQIVAVLKLAMDCILDAARTAGPMGAPSGIIYAALMEHGMTLSVYEQIVSALVRQGKITIEFDCIKLA